MSLEQRERLIIEPLRPRGIGLSVGHVDEDGAACTERLPIRGHLGQHGVDERERGRRVALGERTGAAQSVVTILEPAHRRHRYTGYTPLRRAGNSWTLLSANASRFTSSARSAAPGTMSSTSISEASR